MATNSNTSTTDRETLRRVQQLSNMMDRAFVVPGTSIRFGFDSLVGLIPVVGDTASFAVSGYIYNLARKTGVPRIKRMRMVWNIFIDWLIGLIPLLGDAFDVAYKANLKNADIVREHLERRIDDEAAGLRQEHAERE